ncbi:hypothetical protein AAT19DRAFT_14358 [Rhodotorula toruloides]|uniref:Uncharacterized protein n=1 Tax=Rhodotorula toruloides TaxID=5286 RepID=A0A2T0ABG9_RHOTO|nr:hypothetical protein AAT19DRAFT_14358 [Rhodotorula toruloides]
MQRRFALMWWAGRGRGERAQACCERRTATGGSARPRCSVQESSLASCVYSAHPVPPSRLLCPHEM